jgi:archaellum component FlaF (FlaF/FlaG flagellin family)
LTTNTGIEYFVCVELPDGNAEIVEPVDSTARMSFSATYSAGTTINASGNLRWIKRNGALCKVYNVTSNNPQDITNIRITNLGSKEAVAKGTLYNMDGNVVFKNVELGTLAPKETIRKSSADLVEIAIQNGCADPCEWGRGKLVVSGTFSVGMMEVFALLRRKGVEGIGTFPLLNMSKGASQTACD